MCPLPNCNVSISEVIVRGCTKDLQKTAEYNKYCEFRTEIFIEAGMKSGGMMCCPTENCVFRFQWNPSGGTIPFTCEACTQSYCLNCEVAGGRVGPGHEPLSCQDQIEKLERDAAARAKYEEWQRDNANAQQLFEKMIADNGWKQCPSCAVYIERNQGCDHMTCKKCKCNFCYICGKYDTANPLNRGDCGTQCKARR